MRGLGLRIHVSLLRWARFGRNVEYLASKSIRKLGDRSNHIFSLRYRARVSKRSVEYDYNLIRIGFRPSVRHPRQLTDLDTYYVLNGTRLLDR